MDKINFDTLFNLNAKFGHSWMIYRHEVTESDSTRIEVLDTFLTIFNDQEVFTQQIKWTDYYRNGTTSFVDTIYEGIGALYTSIYPFILFMIYNAVRDS